MKLTKDGAGERPRMSDVAREAGVSLKSVSRVVNNEAFVSQRLRSKVEQAIEKLGYVPDQAARSLAKGRHFSVAVWFDNPSPNYTIKIQTGAYAACRRVGYHLQIDNIDSSIGDSQLYHQLEIILRNDRNDGFILTPPLVDDRRVLDWLDERELNYVRIAPTIDLDRSPAVEMDDFEAAGDMAEYLVNHGHRRFAVVTGPSNHGRALSRYEGFINRLSELCPDAEIQTFEGTFEFDSGIVSGTAIVRQLKPPLAVFAANDDMAVGVMSAVLQEGLRVPQDISVCGFDDSYIARTAWPYLTTIRQPIERLAETAVDLLLGGEAEAARLIRLDYALVERDSVCPPR